MGSTMRNVKLDRNDNIDLYEQVAAEIRRAIADGEANPGERLPPAKDITGTPDRSAVSEQARSLLQFARRHGYRTPDVVRLIQELG
jgi:GntR family transcriptional regulator